MNGGRWASILGALIATVNGAGTAKTYPATPENTGLVISIHVFNDAEVDRKTLIEAETVATEIFRRVGVETRWIDGWDKQYPNLAEGGSSDLTHIGLRIFSQAPSKQFQLANEVMGLAPGSGPDRYLAYIFFNRIRGFNARPDMAGMDGMYLRSSHTLSHVMAHEIGHLLLNMDGHSESGVMRAHWTHGDLQEIASERLSFTPEQAEVIREEIARRSGQLLK